MPIADGMRDVDVPIDTAFNKLHVVLSQSASLISKHILHLGGRKGRVRTCLQKVYSQILHANVCVCACVCARAECTCPSSSFRSEVLT